MVLSGFAKTTTPLPNLQLKFQHKKVNNSNAKKKNLRLWNHGHMWLIVTVNKITSCIIRVIIKGLTKNALSRQAGRPTVHPRVRNRAGRQSVRTQVSPFCLNKKHLTLCSVTSHACRPRLWTPNHKSRAKSSRAQSSPVESSRVELSLQYILLHKELNYGLLVAPILYSQMCARALALAE
jgi:hypothetical protein